MDTKVFKAKNNESGTYTQTISVAEVSTAHVTPVPQNAPGVIVADIGTSDEEHIYYKTKDDGAGTISGLTRDYTNLNGGVGKEHQNGDPWETSQASEYVNNLVDAVKEGYHQEQNTAAYVSGTQFTVATDQTSLYTVGRILRFNQDNTKIGIVSASSYSGGSGLTTVTIDYGTVPSSLTSVEMAIFPKAATNLYATASGVQKSTYSYAADAGASDAYAITLSPVPTAYTTGMIVAFKANTVNTGPATLNVNSLGAKTIKKNYDSDLIDGDIKAGQLVIVIYDGTNFQLLSPISTLIPTDKSWYGLTDGATITIDLTATLKRKFKIPAMGGNRTLALSNAADGDTFLLEVEQDGTGSRLLTYFNKSSTFVDGDVNTGTDVITVNRDIRTGTPIKFSNSGGALPTGLVAGTQYYAIRNSSTTIKVATSIANAQAGTAVDITAASGGGTHTVTTEVAWGTANTAPTLTTGKYRHDLLGFTVVDATNGIYTGVPIIQDY